MAKKRIYKVDYYSFLGFILLAVVTVVIWRFPIGYYILYPFTIMGTWFHEMGHGIMAMCMGANFTHLEIFPNGSGLAHYRYTDLYLNKNLARGLIASAGLMGPPVVGAILILMSKSFKKSTVILYVLSIAMLLSVAIWVRTPVGIVVISLLGAILLLIAVKGGSIFKQLIVQIIGLLACVDTYKQIDYLFMKDVVVDGKASLSDTGSIAANLGMTYWFWAVLIAVASFCLLLYSLYLRNRSRVEE